MTWNYRIFLTKSNDPQLNSYGIHEVYYDDEGKPEMFTENPVGTYWYVDEGLDAGKSILSAMLLAFEKPILTEKDFNHGEEDTTPCSS